MKYVFLYYLITNGLTFVAYYFDKRQAIKNHYRISEKLLLFLSFLSGGVGALLAMKICHHKTTRKKFIYLNLLFLLLSLCLVIFLYFEGKHYQASDFNIITIKSEFDFNQNGIDDFTDILNGAKKEAKSHPKYKSAYYAGGYPSDDEGVCTDTIWRALKEAGYLLKDYVDFDISRSIESYPRVAGKQDKNIDFRRVKNLKVFFDRNTLSLSLDVHDISSFQPGDIVIFGEDYNHIGIISDIRNKKGIPYLIHNAGQLNREENVLFWYAKKNKITGHYRFVLNDEFKKAYGLSTSVLPQEENRE